MRCTKFPPRMLGMMMSIAWIAGFIFLAPTLAMQGDSESGSTQFDEEAMELRDDAKLWNLSLPTLGGKVGEFNTMALSITGDCWILTPYAAHGVDDKR
jgi:hypothetical protein